MGSLSPVILSVFLPFAKLFSRPSWENAVTLLLGAILSVGRRTVCSALRTMGMEHEVGFSKYHRLLNRTLWSPLQGAKILLLLILTKMVPENAPVVLVVDETLERRRGKKIVAKGIYRDAVQSSRSHVVKSSGLKWLSFAVLSKLPFMPRVVAFPFLTILEYSKKCDEARKRRHKTSLDWTGQAVGLLRRWLGKARKIILVGDGGFATGQLIEDCKRFGISLVSRLKMNARLFDFPVEQSPKKRGRPATKGDRLPGFWEMMNSPPSSWQETEVPSYSGEKKRVRFLTSTCLWGSQGGPPREIRWILVVDPSGKFEPLPLMVTDLSIPVDQVIAMYIERWAIEVTFEETREHLGIETQRQWSDLAIQRTTPILMGLYSQILLIGKQWWEGGEVLKPTVKAWHRKEHITFSDILREVRQSVWRDKIIVEMLEKSPCEEKIAQEIQEWAEMMMRRVLQAA